MGVRLLGCLCLCAAALARLVCAGETADLSFRLPVGQTAKYQWTSSSSTEVNGKERGEPFVLKSSLSIEVVVLFQGLAPKGANRVLSVKVEDYSKTEKQSVGTESSEIEDFKGKLRVVQD